MNRASHTCGITLWDQKKYNWSPRRKGKGKKSRKKTKADKILNN